ncbi:MAG: hypothetical protein M1817_006290 [Caeruleum heppii]|nr:MAG: hypothetical protein M1817_006290 [Caeruleum heppii]
MPLFQLDFLPRYQVPLPLYALIIFTCCIAPILALLLLDLSSRRTRQSQPRGCRKLGLRLQSNLADQFSTHYASDKQDGPCTVKSLWIYPVKSCRGVELYRGDVVATGMKHDRIFSFAQRRTSRGLDDDPGEDVPQWTFLTQRQHPVMARIRVEIWVPDPSSTGYSEKAADVTNGGALIITFPHISAPPNKGLLSRLTPLLRATDTEMTFRVPLNPDQITTAQQAYPIERLTIWKDSPEALNMSRHVPPEFRDFIGVKTDLGLFRLLPGKERDVFRCAPRKETMGWQPITGFADAYPLHILNLASVRDLEAKLSPNSPRLSALRFRPNIIVTGPPAYAEDAWKKIVIGHHEFFVACRTARCRLPNTDPETGEKHAVEPDKTLKRFRRIDEGAGEHACLGMQMVPATQHGTIKVGDVVDVLETGDHFYIRQ